MSPRPSKSRSSVRVVLALGALLLALMGAALFVVLGTDPDPVAPETDDATAASDASDEATEESSGGHARRTVASSGGADADVAARLRGRLRAYRSREPVVGLTLTLTLPPEKEGQEPLKLQTQSDATGSFGFDALPPRAGCELSGQQPPWAPVALSGIDLAPRETIDLGTLWLDVPVDLPVEVLELDGSPIEGAAVAVFATTGGAAAAEDDDAGAGASGVAATPTPTATATTDAQGAATVPGLLPGTYHVVARADGRGAGFEDGVLVAPDAPLTRVRLLLAPAHDLEGAVLDADDAPIAEARVIAAPQTSPRKAMDKVEATTDAEGRYRLSGLAPGIHTLYLARADKPLVMGGTVRIPEMTRFDIRLRPTSTLFGTVTSRDGTKLADAEISYAPQGGLPLSARTGEDGTYRLTDVPSGPSQYFRVQKDGFVPFPDPTAPQQGTGEALREGSEVRRDVALEPGVAVTITVLSTEGDRPIEAATVELRMAQMWGGGGKPWTAATGEDGVARFPGIVPGTFLVKISAAGWVQPDMPPNPDAVAQNPLAMPERWRLDVESETTATYRLERGGIVRGKVLGPDGSPFAGAQVSVLGAQPQAPVFSAEDGTFTVDAVPARRRLTASATAPGMPAATSEPFAIEAGEEVENIEITLVEGARITGRVRSSDGSPLEDAYVRYAPGQFTERNPWAFQQFDRVDRHPVAEDGSFEIRGVADGLYTVRADAGGHLPGWEAGLTVAEGRDVGGVDIILETDVEISGRVLTQSGEPVPGALVTAGYTGNGRQRQWGFVTALPGQPQAQTDGDGAFTLRGLKPGSYNVFANAPGHAPANQTDVTTGGGEVELRLGAAERIAGIVKGPDGQGLGGVPVRAQNADQGRNQRFRGWWGGGNQVFTAPDGTFEILDLVEGVYDLTVSAGWIWGRDVNVKDVTKQGVRTGSTDVEILVEAGAVIEGVVLDADDAPVTTGWVSAQNETGGRSRNRWGGNQRWARIASDGTFRISGLEPGAHTLQVYGSFQSEPARGVATGTTDVELRVRAGHSIRGWLVDSQGLAIAQGFNVQIRKQGTDGWAWAQTFQPGDAIFVITGLEDTAYDLKVQASPYAPMEIPNVVVGTEDLAITLRMGQEISGTVVDARGNPVQANVQATQINVPAGQTATNGWARGQPDGSFTVVGLVDGEYRLFVRVGNHAPALVEPVRGGASGLRISVEQGTTVSGTVKYEDGTPVNNARLQLQLEDGLALAWGRTDATGAFVFQHVPSTGTFKLTGRAWGGGQNVTITHDADITGGATDVAVVVR